MPNMKAVTQRVTGVRPGMAQMGIFDRENIDLSVAKPKTRETALPSSEEERDPTSKETPYHNVPSIPTEFHTE